MAYDVSNLVDKMKGKGLDLAEDAAKLVVEGVLDWVVEEALKSENKIDDVVAGLLPAVKPWIMEQVDKIDGEEG